MKNTYKALKKYYSKQQMRGWISRGESRWPISHNFEPPQFEIVVGALLTQNTAWANVEKALKNMTDVGVTSASSIYEIKISTLEKLIRPSGFYKQKAKRLKALSKFVAEHDDFYNTVTREELLAINGVGRETADYILNYACSKSVFVIDAYTRRIFSRLGIISGDEDYDKIRELFEKSMKKDAGKSDAQSASVRLYQEFHALIVEHAKVHCKKQPMCINCPLTKCNYAKIHRQAGVDTHRK